METEKPRYDLYIKIGENELSVAGDSQDFVRDMLKEFKALHAGRETRKAHKKSIQAVGEVSGTPYPEADETDLGDLRELFRRANPRTGVNRVLLYLYYVQQKMGGQGVRPKQIAQALAEIGQKVPKAISTNMGYMKRMGLLEMRNRLWYISNAGVKRVEEKLLK